LGNVRIWTASALQAIGVRVGSTSRNPGSDIPMGTANSFKQYVKCYFGYLDSKNPKSGEGNLMLADSAYATRQVPKPLTAGLRSWGRKKIELGIRGGFVSSGKVIRKPSSSLRFN
jgi:hypothetical protein